MKKFLACILLFALILSTTPAFAAGKLSEDQENFWVVSGYSTYTYCYARYKNIGDKATMVNAGLLEVFDENGDTITSSDYLTAYAKYLEPDEYTYVQMYTSIDDPENTTVDDYLLTVTGKSDMDEYTQRLAVETSYAPDVSTGWFTYDYMYATVTNDTDEPVSDLRVVLVLLDDDDNILYMESESLGSSVTLLPGSSIEVRKYVDSGHKEVFEAEGYVGTKVDAIAYAYIDKD